MAQHAVRDGSAYSISCWLACLPSTWGVGAFPPAQRFSTPYHPQTYNGHSAYSSRPECTPQFEASTHLFSHTAGGGGLLFHFSLYCLQAQSHCRTNNALFLISLSPLIDRRSRKPLVLFLIFALQISKASESGREEDDETNLVLLLLQR